MHRCHICGSSDDIVVDAKFANGFVATCRACQEKIVEKRQRRSQRRSKNQVNRWIDHTMRGLNGRDY